MQSSFVFFRSRWLRCMWVLAVLLVASGAEAADPPRPPMSFDLLSIDLVRQPWTSTGPAGGVASADVLLLGSGTSTQPRGLRVDAAVIRDDGREAYRVESSDLIWMPEGGNGPSRTIEARKEPPALAWASGLAWDSAHGVLAIVSSGVNGYFYRYDTRNHRWLDARAVKYSSVKSLSYDAATGRYLAVSGNAELLIFSGQGEIEDVRPLANVLPQLDSAREPFGVGLEGLNVVAQGDRIALVNVRAGVVTHIWTYELGSRAAQLTYRTPGVRDAKRTMLPELPASMPDPADLRTTGISEPSPRFLTLAAASESWLVLAALVSISGLLALLAWSLARPVQALRGRGMRVLAALVLVAAPLLAVHGLMQSESHLLLGPRQLWLALQLLIGAWRLHLPLEQVFGAHAQLNLIANSTCAMAGLACCALLVSPRLRVLQWLTGVVVVLLAIAPARHFATRHQEASRFTQELRAGETVFDALCKSAGVKRLYAVGNIEGVRLTGLRGEATADARKDRNWSDAGIPGDLVGMAYIRSFLDFEYHDRGNPAWSIPGLPGAVTLRGYRFVDVLQPDGNYLRYRLAADDSKSELDVEQIAPEQAARYAVSHARSDTPQDRLHWVAGATVSVTDTQTGTQIAELKAFSHVPPKRSGEFEHRDWAGARTCPAYDDVPGAMVRMFVGSTLQHAPR